jgi:drug/metabolite transporter (DMT)-like permease
MVLYHRKDFSNIPAMRSKAIGNDARELPGLKGPSYENRQIGTKNLPPIGFVLLAALSFSWGLNWPFMKIALTEIPPWTFRMLCLVFGGAGLLILVRTNGMSLLIPKREIVPLFVVAFMNVTGWHLFTAHGLVYMNAGRATIIAFTMPVWTALLGSILLKERLTMGRIVGLGLGIAGIVVLMGPDIRVFGSAPVGAFLMLGAAFSWAAGTISVKYFTWTMPTALLTGWQLTLGGIPVIIGALTLEPITAIFPLSWHSTLIMAFIILVPIIFGQWAWFKVVGLFPATIAAVGTLVIPIIGVFSSALLLGEPIGFQEITALALVVSALAIVMVIPELL